MHSPQLVQLSKVAVLRGSISTGQLVTQKLHLAQASPREASYSMCSVSRVLNRNCHGRGGRGGRRAGGRGGAGGGGGGGARAAGGRGGGAGGRAAGGGV